MQVGSVFFEDCMSLIWFPVHAMDRALLVDTLPPSSQVSGNAWAARMLGFGSMVGFFMSVMFTPLYCILSRGF